MNTASLLARVTRLQSVVSKIDWRLFDDGAQYQLVCMERKLQYLQRELSQRIDRAPGRRDLTRPFYLGRNPADVDPRPTIYRGARAL